jgi:hypothetical protein
VIVYVFAAATPHTNHRTSELVLGVWNQAFDILYVRAGALRGAVHAYQGIRTKVRRARN